MKLHPLFTKSMLIVIVLGPIFWLTLTEDGRRRTDLLVLDFIQGLPPIEIHFDRLDGEASPEQFRGALPNVDWKCQDLTTQFGDSVCLAAIGGLNGNPARRIALYFDQERLQAIRADYRSPYHERLRRQLERAFGIPQPPTASKEQTPEPTLEWRLPNGILVIKENVDVRNGAPAMFWISKAWITRRGPRQADLRPNDTPEP